MAVREHRDPGVMALMKATGGRVSFDLLYLPKDDVLQRGYETLRRVAVFVSDEYGRPIPEEVQETLRWLRDHFGPEEARKEAVEKHAPNRPAPLTEEAAAEIVSLEVAIVKGNPNLKWEHLSEMARLSLVTLTRGICARLGLPLVSSKAPEASSTSPASPSSSTPSK
jgi:hypothetical protein